MRLPKTPHILRKISLKNVFWDMPAVNKELFLTFDDGPHPDITPEVLSLLKLYHAKGTFFCVGENVRKYPDTYKQILAAGHSTGNHTYNHLDGWKTKTDTYLKNILACEQTLSTSSNLFRPPYGHMTPKQLVAVRKNYKIILWSVLSYDFDRKISSDQCIENVLHNSRNGSIIVFHDSQKAAGNMLSALPVVLESFAKKRFTFKSLS